MYCISAVVSKTMHILMARSYYLFFCHIDVAILFKLFKKYCVKIIFVDAFLDISTLFIFEYSNKFNFFLFLLVCLSTRSKA